MSRHALGALGFFTDARLALPVALVRAGHVGADRGFGLELGFENTHLPTRPAPVAALRP